MIRTYADWIREARICHEDGHHGAEHAALAYAKQAIPADNPDKDYLISIADSLRHPYDRGRYVDLDS